jgi:hypothetical protein
MLRLRRRNVLDSFDAAVEHLQLLEDQAVLDLRAGKPNTWNDDLQRRPAIDLIDKLEPECGELA